MNARRHPSLEDFRAWLADADVAPATGEHLASCSSCQALVDALRAARRAKSRWQEPPDDLVERALGVRGEKRLPRARRRREIQWETADVRSPGGSSVADDAKIVAGSCPGGEVSVLVNPPLENANWKFEARVWFSTPDADAVAVIGLVHDDHVLQRHDAPDGATVRFEDVVPEGWSLEIHMPNGDTVVLDDPFAAG